MDSPRTGSPRSGSMVPPPPPPPPPPSGVSASAAASTTNQLTLMLQQALAKGDLSKSLEAMSSLLSLSGDNRLKADLLLKLIDLTKHFNSLIVAAPMHTAPLLKCLRLLLIDKEPTLRSQSLRVLRYLLTDWEMVHQMLVINMDLLIVRSLERESKYLWERMQALKFIRQWMTMLSSAQALSKSKDPTALAAAHKGLPTRAPIGITRSIVQSLVSIAEQPKDDFRRVCLDAIRELTLISPGMVASCNGIRTLVDSILDPACVDIANSLTLTLLYLIDSESTRGFLRPSVDLVRLISVFTDTTAADNPERENRRAAAHKALVLMMRSWTGILVLTSDPQCLRALIGMLNLPASIKGSSWARETIFDLLFEIIHVVKASDVRSVAARIRCSMAAMMANGNGIPTGGGVNSTDGSKSPSCVPASYAYPPNLLHSYMVMLLLSFLECDLLDILTQLSLSSDVEFSTVASKLLGEILGLSVELLPRQLTQKMNAMRGVIAAAATFDTQEGGGNTMTPYDKQNGNIGGGGDDSFFAISSRVRAVNVLSSLCHSELSTLSSSSGCGFGLGLAAGGDTMTAVTVQPPGTGWGWTGPLGINWEQVAQQTKEANQQQQQTQVRRDSHSSEWLYPSNGLTRGSSFSGLTRSVGGGMHSSSDQFANVEHTPTGRRGLLHGIRLERLALRSDLFPNPAREVSSGAYGTTVAGHTDALAPANTLSSQTALVHRNQVRHRMALFQRATAYQAARTSSDYHAEEADLALLLKKSQVLSTKEFKAWDWDYIQLIIDKYMMVSPSHTAYLVLKTKFPKRLLSFLRADKHHFVDLDWNLFHLRFTRMGVSLLKSMLGCPEGRDYSWFIELVDGIFLSILWEIASNDGRKDVIQPSGTGYAQSTAMNNPMMPAPSPTHATQTHTNETPASFLAGRRLSHLASGLPKSKAKIFQSLSRSGCSTRLIREYFVFLGILATSTHGQSYFDKFGFYDVILPLAKDPSKDYITKLIIAATMPIMKTNVPVQVQAKWKRVIEAWLAIPTNFNKEGGTNVYLRLWAVEHLLILWRANQANLGSATVATEIDLTGAGVLSSQPSVSVNSLVSHALLTNPGSTQSTHPDSSMTDSGGVTTWLIHLLLSQLSSLDLHLRAAVLDILEEICVADPSALHILIAKKPTILKDLTHLTTTYMSMTTTGPNHAPLFPAAQRILTMFMASKSGLDVLRTQGIGGASWLEIQMNEWKFQPASPNIIAINNANNINAGGACVTYVKGLEEALVGALSSSTSKDDSDHLAGEEGLTATGSVNAIAGGNASGASKLDELSIAPSPPTSTASAWSGPVLRSALDDHLFSLIHQLPWVVDLTIEYPQGRSVQVMTECWVVTTSHQPTTTTATSAPSGGNMSMTPPPRASRTPSSSDDFGSSFSSSSSSTSSDSSPVGAPVTYLVCQVLDLDGFPRPAKVDSNVTLRARISIGAGAHSQNVPDLTVHAATGAAGGPATPAGEARNNNRYGGAGVSGTSKDAASQFQEEREPERDWARIFFPDQSGHASEYVCRPRDRDRVSLDHPYLTTPNQSDLCGEDEARWHFEVPDANNGILAPSTHGSIRGPTLGTSPTGVTTLESVWFPLPMPASTVPAVTLLPHLYGELVRTEDGAALLAASGQIKEFDKTIRDCGLSGCDGKSPSGLSTAGFIQLPSASAALEKRAALWAIGHIGATNYGFQLINQQAPGLVQYISAQSVACSTLSMRGTCFYILGLLGRSSLGRSYLSDLGWSFSPFPGGSIAIPGSILTNTNASRNEASEEKRIREEELEDGDEERKTAAVAEDGQLSSGMRSLALVDETGVVDSASSSSSPLAGFLDLAWPASRYHGSWATDPANVYGINSSKRTRKVGGVDSNEEKANGPAAASTTKDDANEVLSSQDGIEVILSHLSNLCNHVTQKNSLQALRTMKAQPHHAHFFTSPLLLFETFKLLAAYSYKLPARRFLFFDLFGSVTFNMHTIAQFDQPFQAENVASAAKQKAREATNAQ